MNELLKELLALLDTNARRYNAKTVFQDWVELMGIALRNVILKDPELEKYLEIAKKYTEEEVENFSKAYGCLVMLFEREITDWLGRIYMESGAGNAKTGQFFTPFNISEMVALIEGDTKDDEEFMYEPACGAGAMILARAKTYLAEGKNPQAIMKVVAQDIDLNCCYMAFVQMSILGLQAKVVHGDALMDTTWSTMYTPFYLMNCDSF